MVGTLNGIEQSVYNRKRSIIDNIVDNNNKYKNTSDTNHIHIGLLTLCFVNATFSKLCGGIYVYFKKKLIE